MRLPMLARALAIAIVAALILVPIGLIGGKIAERQARAQGVLAQFAAETSGPQLIVGPLLAVTCEETFTEERQVMRGGKAETIAQTKTTSCPTAYFVPRTFKATAAMPVETLHRGIYSIRLYRAEVELTGEFDWPQPPSPSGANSRIWKEVYIGSFVQDPRGIKTISSSFSPSVPAAVGDSALAQFPIREHLGAYVSRQAGTALPYTYKMGLVGTSSLHIAPVGENSEIGLSSDWPHPSFSEAWSPDRRTITRDGFQATWRITSVATGGRAMWNKLASEGKLASAAGAGVSLFDPVNVYALSYRATEYAFLFVLFTFSALALTEVITAVRLHPLQYALVGSAVAVFFLLLLALSEHVDFASAYALAAAGCVALLTFYLRHPLGNRRRAGAFFGIFVALYGSLYVLLMSEDHALLLGSLMVFLLLAIAMIATRKLDWGALSARMMASRNSVAPALDSLRASGA
jgi:inner membrane protein